MTTKWHQVSQRVASASRLALTATPLTPEQQSLADEQSAAWTRRWEQAELTGLPVNWEFLSEECRQQILAEMRGDSRQNQDRW